MEINLDQLTSSERYKVLSSLITPRPIAWVTTVDPEGVVNAAPFSYFNVFGSNPPIVAFAPGNKESEIPKDTARNIKLNKEFVVNMVAMPQVAAMVKTAEDLPQGESELISAGLSAEASVSVSPPRITGSPVAFECREWGTLEIGSNRLVIGLVQHVYVEDGVMDPLTYHLEEGVYAPVGRMASPNVYCTTDHQFCQD